MGRVTESKRENKREGGEKERERWKWENITTNNNVCHSIKCLFYMCMWIICNQTYVAEMCRERCLAVGDATGTDDLSITSATVLENLWPVLSILVTKLTISHDNWVDCRPENFQNHDCFLYVRIFDSRWPPCTGNPPPHTHKDSLCATLASRTTLHRTPSTNPG